MVFPVYLHVGSIAIHPHLLFEALAYAVGFRIYLELRRQRGDLLQDYHRWWIIAAAAIGAVVGSKLTSSLVSLTATSIGGNTRER